MSLYVYNTLARKKEIFEPIESDHVRMYVCGVTVYDECHLGHGRVYVTFDMIRRYLRHLGYKVTYVQNFTDIDDKIIKKAVTEREKNKKMSLIEHTKAITKKYTNLYFSQMDALGVARAEHYPKATEHIQHMQTMIGDLIRKEMAYDVDGDVYFSVKTFHAYGKLSKKNLDDLLIGARVEKDRKKRDPLDFVLWKKAKPQEPSWESPWGAGRPAWHIECSAMATHYLGVSFDIHGGGMDLTFPHHENEIAQSEGCSKKPFAKYWLHNGFVNVEKEKMSKSLKNYFSLTELFEKYPAEVIRFFIMATHYRSPIDFSLEQIEGIHEQIKRGYEFSKNVQVYLERTCSMDSQVRDRVGEIKKYHEEFFAAMNDDFNTPKAIGVLFSLIRDLNQSLGQSVTKDVYLLVKQGFRFFKEASQVLNIFQSGRIIVVSDVVCQDSLKEGIRQLLEMRLRAKNDKNWNRADDIRDELVKLFPDMDIEDKKPGAGEDKHYTVASYSERADNSHQKMSELISSMQL